MALNDKVQRIDRDLIDLKRNLHEVKDDIWIMLKAEARLDEFENRLPPTTPTQ